MAEGDKWRIYVPYELGYGERGHPPRIPPFSPLVFEMELHKVNKGGKSVAVARDAFQKAIYRPEESL